MAEPVSPAAAEVGSRVRALLNERGWSQEELGDRAGVHRTFIGQLERGQRSVSLSNLLKVAAGLDVDPAELVQGLKPT
jgi:transcriptional regulator with XRE-family HTH domain